MKLYNRKTKQIENCDLNREVSMYTCGPTVYDYPHIGNWYTFIRYDLLARTLRANKHTINWIMNITDVGHLVSDSDTGEDKIEKGAKRDGKTAWDVADFYTKYFIDGLNKLNFSTISNLPKATDYIEQQIELVKILDDKGYAYKISDGVYFDTSKFASYHSFAELNISGQEEGARVDVNDEKRNPSDFALWKFSQANENRDMEWPSPWGTGFPGWHLECSAMIHALLEEPIDFHAGGIDHIPVHHTNEIAQSEAAFDKPLAKYWMHCNHIQVDGKKMSKSLGNFYTLEDIISKGYSMNVFRMHVLSGHYRSQSEFSWETIDATKNRLQGWVNKLALIKQSDEDITKTSTAEVKNHILSNLENDLNSPLVLSYIDESIDSIPKNEIEDFVSALNDYTGLDLSLYLQNPNEQQNKLLRERELAKQSKDWAKSDKLRSDIEETGLTILDTKDGQKWSRLV